MDDLIESNKAHNGDLRNRVVEASARQKIILETINERMKQTDNTAKKLSVGAIGPPKRPQFFDILVRWKKSHPSS
jgi:hypothetical protein